MSTAVNAVTGWVLFSGLLFSVGPVVSRWLIVPRAWPDGGARLDDALRRSASVGLAGALLTVAGLALYFLRQLLEFRDPFVPWTEDAGLLLATSWGTSWKAALIGGLVVGAGFALARSGRRASWWLVTPAAVALAAFPGFTGHASGVENGRTLALLADWSHVVAASAWMGGLAVVLFLGRRGNLPRLVPAFSPVAMVSVGVLVASGTYAAWLHLPGLGALFTTGYGRLLLAKLALVAVVLGFGARNFRVLTPRLGSAEGDGAMHRSATLELTVAQLVLLATALLVRTSPMGS